MFLLIVSLVFAERLSVQEGLFCSMFTCDPQDGKLKPVKIALSLCMDFAETKTHYVVTVEMPGIVAKDIKIETENRNLCISGEMKQAIEDKDQKSHHKECRYGEFKRELSLPEDALIDGIQAKCKDSVLTITIPRKPSDRKIIQIQTT